MPSKEYYSKNKDKIKEYKKIHPFVYKNKEKRHEYSREFRLKTKFGITIYEYDQILKTQDYKCAICLSDKSWGTGRFHVDHNHITGEIRGLLCQRCNTGLGLLYDSEDILLKAITYLRKNA